jgi:lipoprotein-anchoring transpeptidase ErfK/SrfK
MNYLDRDFRIMCVSWRQIPIANIANGRFRQIAILTAACTLGAGSQADAALDYWQDYDPGYYRSEPMVQPRRQKVRRPLAKKDAAAQKETGAKPQGPLIIAVSIEKQRVRIYDAKGFFAESPISSGMPGHSTPMGVFSIIQKQKFHRSNIYSGAPMPYMQRITWSGVAMHAGVLPGYPASHGCIRMPMAFAVKMWNWTRMGARVIVTPGEMTPASFSHPLLVTRKVVPQPVALEEPKLDAPLGTKSDKGADAGATAKATTEASLDLRSTVGHAEPPASAPLRAQTRTADASSVAPTGNSAATMSDASSAAAPAGDSVKPDDASNAEAKSETAKSETESASAKSVEAASSDDKPAEAKSSDAFAVESAIVEDKLAETGVDAKADEAPTAAISKAGAGKADATKAGEPKPFDKPVETIKAVADAPTSAPDVNKDPARLPGVAKPEPPKRTGQVAVFISRKDSKLYVRQNFAPLFEAPVTIAPSDRPLGTHVFTAEADKGDANVLRWSVVSLPVTARNAVPNDDDGRPTRRRRMAGASAETKPLPVPDSPTEALDRITIPPDAMARITEALTTGASIIVSDQGINQGETGEGTDFIVSLR